MKKLFIVLSLSIVFVSCSSRKQLDQVTAKDTAHFETAPSENSTTTPSSSGSTGPVYQDDIALQAIQDAINEYNKASRGSDNSMMYANAAVIAELYRGIGDVSNYRYWTNIADKHTKQMESDLQREIDNELNRIEDY
jgi:hypothetical protein